MSSEIWDSFAWIRQIIMSDNLAGVEAWAKKKVNNS